jgi:hypothetical protein
MRIGKRLKILARLGRHRSILAHRNAIAIDLLILTRLEAGDNS